MAHARAHDRGSLSLADMTLTAQDLDVELPDLRCVCLQNCGSVTQMEEIIDSLRARNAGLCAAKCEVRGARSEKYPSTKTWCW